jgi:sugar lactone lactonase YvrE
MQNENRRLETIDIDECNTCSRPSVSTDCPLWCSHKKCLIYVDSISNRVCVHYPSRRDGTGRVVADGRSDHMTMSQRVGFAVPILRSCGLSCLFLLVGLDDSVVEVNFTEKIVLRTIAVMRDPSQLVVPTESGRLCVGSCSSDGTLFCGYIAARGQDAYKGSMYYLSIFGELTSAIRSESFMVPTGFAWLGYDNLFFSDGGSNKIYSCRIQEKDGVKNFTARKVVFKLSADSASLGHRLGGIAIDAEGKLWVALTGAYCILRIDPSTGLEVYRLALPMKNPTSCAFGGYELCDLYVTFCSTEGVMHEDCSVDDGAVLVLKGNGRWGVPYFRGAQGVTMADLPEKGVLRACTPVRETEAGLDFVFRARFSTFPRR